MTTKKLTAATIRDVRARKARGERYEDIARATGLSTGSVANALSLGKRSGKHPKKASPAAPAPSGEALPSGEDDGLEQMIETAKRLVREAEAEGNLAGVATMGRLMAALLEHRRKAMPPPSVEEQGMVLVPAGEMTELGAMVAARLHAMVDRMAGKP